MENPFTILTSLRSRRCRLLRHGGSFFAPGSRKFSVAIRDQRNAVYVRAQLTAYMKKLAMIKKRATGATIAYLRSLPVDWMLHAHQGTKTMVQKIAEKKIKPG